jgi:hypothetical protein
MVISSMIPSSLSYSSSYSSSSPTSASSTNAGTVFLPIQVTKSQKNNNNNTIKYSTITTTINEGQRSYRYVQKQPIQQKTFRCLKPEKKQIHLVRLKANLLISNDIIKRQISDSSGTNVYDALSFSKDMLYG